MNQRATDAHDAFQVGISDDQILDLTERLGRTRWAEPETVDDWSQGVPLTFLRRLCRYWAENYDWKAAEQRLNAFPQFRSRLDGLGIHYLHVRSPYPDALPLVLTHGWPGSVVEFHKVIGPLSDPVAYGGDAHDAFHVVCPSLPGYGFSDKPSTTGWDVDRIAETWVALMDRLGYDRYGAQGGDWGSSVTSAMGRLHPEKLVGIHLNMPTVELGPETDDLTESERAALDDYAWHRRWGTGYSTEQSTRPQTVGYGLVDSPVALCAWIVEKFWAWSDCGGDPLSVFSEDELLDNVMMYWLPAAGASSARLYWEDFQTANLEPVNVPTGCTIFPREIRRPSRRWAARRFTDIRWWNEVDRGGHFGAFEQPSIFVDEVRSTFRLFRDNQK